MGFHRHLKLGVQGGRPGSNTSIPEEDFFCAWERGAVGLPQTLCCVPCTVPSTKGAVLEDRRPHIEGFLTLSFQDPVNAARVLFCFVLI